MTSSDRAVRKYLAAWAEPEIAIARAVSPTYGEVLVVPACDEGARFVADLEALPDAFDERALVIVVVNGSVAHSETLHAANASLLRELSGGARVLSDEPPAFLAERDGFDLLCVDRASEPWRFPAKRGVGLARKVGCDLALALAASGRVTSPWIHTSDADARQPTERFRVAAAERDERVAALTFPYEHVPEADVGEAVRLYEISLRYWVAALAWAGSPYAFSSIGSTFAIRANAYAQVRGFPRREAGEDFHLLDKVAKLGVVRTPVCPPLLLSGRASDRVPFGTGRAVRRMRDEHVGEDRFTLYDPRTFEVLRAWLRTMKSWAATDEFDPESLPTVAREVLDDLGAFDALRALERRPSTSDRERAFHGWFDALKTLRFIHGVRDREFPNRPFRDALREAPFPTAPATAGVEEMLRHLAARPVSDAGVPTRQPAATRATTPSDES